MERSLEPVALRLNYQLINKEAKHFFLKIKNFYNNICGSNFSMRLTSLRAFCKTLVTSSMLLNLVNNSKSLPNTSPAEK